MAKTNTIVQLKQENDNERMWYVEYWANYVNSHTDKEWSAQQNILINSGGKLTVDGMGFGAYKGAGAGGAGGGGGAGGVEVESGGSS